VTTCVSRCTIPSCKHILDDSKIQKLHKMENCWLHCGWMEILVQHSSKHYQPHSTNHCIHYTQEYNVNLEICLQRQFSLHLTVCLVTSTSTGTNRTLMWWCVLPIHTCSLESLGKISRLLSVSHHKWISKTTFTCPFCTYYDKLSTHHSTYFSENYVTSLQE
jgi:hypothetical protein